MKQTKYKILGTTNEGDTYFFENAKIKTILEKLGYNTATPIYRDNKKGKPQKTGYYLTQRGFNPIWLELFTIKNYFEEDE